MYSVEGIKENVQRTHDVGSNKYIIYIVPKDDWFVLNVNFCESLIYNVVHYYVDKQRSNGRTHCYAVNLFVGFAVELESANTPSLCGLLKTHKPGNPMRPIISAVGSFNHEAAKWLPLNWKVVLWQIHFSSFSFEFGYKLCAAVMK